MSYRKAEALNGSRLTCQSAARKRRTAPGTLCLLLAAVILAGCGGSRGGGQAQGPQTVTPPAQAEPILLPPILPDPGVAGPQFDDGRIRIALLAPLSGREAAAGQALQNAAELALFDAADENFLLRPYDTAGDAQRAEQAVQQAIAEGADLILGPLFSAATTAIAPYARAAQVPVISFSNDEVVAGDGVYVLGFLPRDQVDRVVRYAEVQGITKYATLAPSTPYGRSVAAALQDSTRAHGVETVKVTFYDPTTPDLSPIVKQFSEQERRERQQRLDDLPYQAILLPEGGTRLRALAPMLAYYDIDHRQIRLLGTAQWDAGDVATEPSLGGGWYAAPGEESRIAFERRFRDAFGSTPPVIAGLAYDATALAAILAREGKIGGFSAARLTADDGFAGVNGIFRLRANGLNERGLAVYEIDNGTKRVIDPAPQSFAPPLIN